MTYPTNTMKEGKVISLQQYVDDLPEYEANRACPKCGFDKIDDKYRDKNEDALIIAEGVCSYSAKKGYESIARKCLRCKYVWETKVLGEIK